LYGETPLPDLEYVRNYLQKEVDPTRCLRFILMSADTAINDCLNPVVPKLKHYDYDVGYAAVPKEDAYDHKQLSTENSNADNLTLSSLWDLQRPFQFKVVALGNLPAKPENDKDDRNVVYVAAFVAYGENIIGDVRTTRLAKYAPDILFNQTLVFGDILVAELPRESTLYFYFYARKGNESQEDAVFNKQNDVPFGVLQLPLFDCKGVLKMGMCKYFSWTDDERFLKGKVRAPVVQEVDRKSVSIALEFDKFTQQIVYPNASSIDSIPEALVNRYKQYERDMRKKYNVPASRLAKLVETGPLYKIKDDEKWFLWENRDNIKTQPKGLTKFLLSVPWKFPYARLLAMQYLEKWTAPAPLEALILLDYRFPDFNVRAYAVSLLNKLADGDLFNFLLQIVQALKYELYHDNPIARFLLQRAVRNTHVIGDRLYWLLLSELEEPPIFEKHGVLLCEYLRTCDLHRANLLKIKKFIDDLLSIALLIKKAKDKDEQKQILHEELKKVAMPDKTFRLPIKPRVEVKNLKVEKCKVMSSKKKPLWLVFENVDPDAGDFPVIFKAGDDLRQDFLTLVVLRVMDNLWRAQKMDLHIKLYDCVSTGYMEGMIEVVQNADTIANIMNEYSGAAAALSKDPLKKWLENNKKSSEKWQSIVNNFAYSCAGYCVATYVLGIGDRHNDNIMLSRDGDMFHIDFGHILGNFKTFVGIKRETTPFVFTVAYAEVMGGSGSDDFATFSGLAVKSYNILRANASLLVALFILMVPTGIPEIPDDESIEWISDCLALEEDDAAAGEIYRKLIQLSLTNYRVRFNDLFHIWKHKK